ncbi:MAG TPA: RdgB/HAM1 family non-canonical purine NTP pyrophosphatase [Acidobacteriota bacterium]|jgi:XTP/dITP diphosphohydrolase|nr:RdgB/HAM1 family non-canonical purine NTP pyrophosphatase [Acidobacteriota bacterium]
MTVIRNPKSKQSQIHNPMDLVIATANPGKLSELREMLDDVASLKYRSLADFGTLPPALEGGSIFGDNARSKAEHYHRLLRLPVLADDSGLEVDLLNGEPGVWSARYAGPNATDRENTRKLLAELQCRKSARSSSELPSVLGYSLLSAARFVCALTLFASGAQRFFTQATCEGFISAQPRGKNGFGYDPIFFVLQEGKTMAELPAPVKNRISHRAKAARELKTFLSAHVSLTF